MEKSSVASLLAAAIVLFSAPYASAFSPRIVYQGREWAPAQPTNLAAAAKTAAESLPGVGDVSPAPTEAPKHPDFGAMELFKRDFTKGSDTCGFAAQFKSEPWTCFRVGASCVSFSTAMGCCAGPEPDCYSSLLMTCRNYSSGQPSSCGSGTLCCPSSSPSCFTWQYSTSNSPGSTWSLFNCYASGGTGTLVDKPPGLTIISSSPSSSPTTSVTAAAATTTSSPTPPPPPTSAPDSNPSNNTGAIVGGAVGGAAIIAAVVVAIVWLMMRSKRDKAGGDTSAAVGNAGPGFANQSHSPGVSPGQTAATPSTMPVSPQMANNGYFMVPQQQPNPDPHQSYYDPAKQQPSPVYSDPRYSVVQPQHTGHSSPDGVTWTTSTSPYRQPSELGNTNPVGSVGNRAELV